MGRGSSKAGGGGNINPGNVKSTYDMISNRGKNPQETDQVLSVAKDIVDQYGKNYALNGTFQVAKMSGNSYSMAYYDSDGNIAINEKYFDSAKMDTAYDGCVDSGFHPSRGNKTGLQATAAHEYGHALTDMAGKTMGKDLHSAATQIVNEAAESLRGRAGELGEKRMTPSRVSKHISGYAQRNDAETIAEAFSDVYCNGKKASIASQAVVNVLNKYLK